MFGDAHAIAGYIIAKFIFYLFEGDVKFESYNPCPLFNCGLSQWFNSLPLISQYLLCAAIIANLPDIDVLLLPIIRSKWSDFHRTWTHSLYISLIIIPVLSIFTSHLLGIGLFHALIMSAASFYSHLYTDWITSYGTGLLWPFDKRMFTLGVITIFDLPSLIIWYLHFTLSRFNILSPPVVLVSFFMSLSLFLYWRRLLLLDVYEKAGIRPNENSTWITPSNLIPNKFFVYTWVKEKETIILKEPIYASISNGNYGREFYSCVAPREAVEKLRKNREIFLLTMKDTLPSVLFVLGHAIWFFSSF